MGFFNRRSKVNIVTSALPQNPDAEEEVYEKDPTTQSLYYGEDNGSDFWNRSDDTLNQKDENIRRAIKQFSKAWRFTHLTPLETLADDPMQYLRPNPLDKTWVGYEAVHYWLSLFEADNRQTAPDLLSQHLAEYYRGFGEIFTEQRYIVDPLLKTIGFKEGFMLKRIDVMAPWHVPRNSDSVVKDENGNLVQLKFTDLKGKEVTVEKPDIQRFIHLTNRPSSELRGISYILPLLRPFGEEYDLRRVAFDAFDNYTRPVEWYKIYRNLQGSPRLIDSNWKTTRDNLKSQVMGNRHRVKQALYTDEHVEPSYLGANQKMVDPTNALNRFSKENNKAAMQANVFEGEDVNRATMQEIRRASHRIHAQGIDYKITKRFWERNIFPIVLQTRGVDARLSPIIKFPKFEIPEERLQTAMADQVERDVFGLARVKQIAEQRGYEFDEGDFLDVQMDDDVKAALQIEYMERE